jgi:hypothetical protein
VVPVCDIYRAGSGVGEAREKVERFFFVFFLVGMSEIACENYKIGTFRGDLGDYFTPVDGQAVYMQIGDKNEFEIVSFAAVFVKRHPFDLQLFGDRIEQNIAEKSKNNEDQQNDQQIPQKNVRFQDEKRNELIHLFRSRIFSS